MKKLLAAILCIMMMLTWMPAVAEETLTGYEAVAQTFTYFHYACIELSGQYEFGNNYPLLTLTGHSYGDVAAYSTESRLYDVVFIPDATGMGVAEIHILGWAEIAGELGEESAEMAHVGYNHVCGLLFPFILEHAASDSNDVFGDSLVKALAEGSVYANGRSYTSDPIDYAGIADVVVYVSGDTYAIGIFFAEPVTEDILAEHAWLLESVLE